MQSMTGCVGRRQSSAGVPACITGPKTLLGGKQTSTSEQAGRLRYMRPASSSASSRSFCACVPTVMRSHAGMP